MSLSNCSSLDEAHSFRYSRSCTKNHIPQEACSLHGKGAQSISWIVVWTSWCMIFCWNYIALFLSYCLRILVSWIIFLLEWCIGPPTDQSHTKRSMLWTLQSKVLELNGHPLGRCSNILKDGILWAVENLSQIYNWYSSVSTSEDSDSSSCNTIDVKGRKNQFLSMCHQTDYQS